MTRLISNTRQAGRQALPFGIAGTIGGAFLGAAIAFVDNDSARGRQYVEMATIGGSIGGACAQIVGMVYVNAQTAGSGILATPIGATMGATAMMGVSKFYRGHTVSKTIMKYGLVGLVGGGLIGGCLDWLRTTSNP